MSTTSRPRGGPIERRFDHIELYFSSEETSAHHGGGGIPLRDVAVANLQRSHYALQKFQLLTGRFKCHPVNITIVTSDIPRFALRNTVS